MKLDSSVTGAASGLGAATAPALAAKGPVGLRSPAAGEKTQTDYEGKRLGA